MGAWIQGGIPWEFPHCQAGPSTISKLKYHSYVWYHEAESFQFPSGLLAISMEYPLQCSNEQTLCNIMEYPHPYRWNSPIQPV